MTACKDCGTDHEDNFLKLRRRFRFFTGAYFASIGLGFYGAYLLLSTGGLVFAVAAFLIHFTQINMKGLGQIVEHLAAQTAQRRDLPENSKGQEHGKSGTYL